MIPYINSSKEIKEMKKLFPTITKVDLKELLLMRLKEEHYLSDYEMMEVEKDIDNRLGLGLPDPE